MYIKIYCLRVLLAVYLVFGGVVEAIPTGHIVKPSDTLSHLSQHYLKHAKHWRELYSWNSDIKNPNLIYPGQYIKFIPPKGAYLSVSFGYVYNAASGQLSSIILYPRPGLSSTLIAHNNNGTNGPDIHIEAG